MDHPGAPVCGSRPAGFDVAESREEGFEWRCEVSACEHQWDEPDNADTYCISCGISKEHAARIAELEAALSAIVIHADATHVCNDVIRQARSVLAKGKS